MFDQKIQAKTEKAIWAAAFQRGLLESAPDEAAEIAEYALKLFQERWYEAPPLTPEQAEANAAFEVAAARAAEIMARRRGEA